MKESIPRSPQTAFDRNISPETSSNASAYQSAQRDRIPLLTPARIADAGSSDKKHKVVSYLNAGPEAIATFFSCDS